MCLANWVTEGATGVQAPPVITPVQVSNLNGAVTIALGPSAQQSLAIVQPVAALSTTSLSFGDQLVGMPSAPQMITIQNNGQDPLTIKGFSVSGAAAADFKRLGSVDTVHSLAGLQHHD